ncbi:MAG: STAS domain-containing protein [Ruminococcus sp.]
MNIEKILENNTLTLLPQGRLDSVTSPELESLLDQNLDSATNLILDLKDLEYTSSAGLRVLLKAHKAMNNKGDMKVLNVNDSVMEVLEMTGFVDMLTIE